MANETLPTESIVWGFQSTPNVRGTFDIIQTCVATIFLCTYTLLYLNVKPELRRSAFLWYKTKWVLFTLLCPEIITAIAAEQWRSARQSVKDFRILRNKFAERIEDGGKESAQSTISLQRMEDERTQWSSLHAFFADMGGVRVKFPDYDAFPVNSYQLHWLVKNCHIDFPNIDKKTIQDKDKADLFARVVTLLQVAWFTIQCIGRGVEQLRLTTLELLTVAFSCCAMHALFFWRRKPLDVDDPITISATKTLHNVLEEFGQDLAVEYLRTPLDFVLPPPRFSYVEPFFTAFQWSFNLDPPIRTTPVSTFNNTEVIPPYGLLLSDIGFALVFVPLYYGIHLVAWNFTFPSLIEVQLWRMTAIMQAVTCTVFMLACWPGCHLGQFCFGADRQYTMQQAAAIPRWVSRTYVIPTVVMYIFSRLYVIVEGFVGLRSQPSVVYETVNWWQVLPHF